MNRFLLLLSFFALFNLASAQNSSLWADFPEVDTIHIDSLALEIRRIPAQEIAPYYPDQEIRDSIRSQYDNSYQASLAVEAETLTKSVES